MILAKEFFPAQSTIFREGEKPDYVYLVERGKVQLVKSHGREKLVLEEIGIHGIFGEMALIDHHGRSATAIALENTYCIKITRTAFEERLGSMDLFMRGIFRILVERLRDTTAQLSLAVSPKDE